MSKSYSNLAKDGSARVIQVATSIQTSDATGTPQTSPLAYTTALITALTIPTRAAEIVLKPSTDLKVSEDSTMTSYFVILANTTQVFPLARADNFYVQGNSSDGTLNFYFHLI